MKLKSLFLASLTCICVAASAQQPIDEFIVKLKQENEKISTITSHFKQTKTLPIMDEPIISEGSFYFDRNGKVCMEYTEPQGDILLINGETVQMITNGKQAQSKNRFAELKSLLISCFKGDLQQLGNCNFSLKNEKNLYVVTAEMNNGKAKGLPSKVILSYDQKDYTITSMEMDEANGNITLYQLSGKKNNQPIDESVFTPKKK